MRLDTCDRHGSYRCPDCGDKVMLRRGRIRRAHFAHLQDQVRACDFSAGETEEHCQVRVKIADAINASSAVVLCEYVQLKTSEDMKARFLDSTTPWLEVEATEVLRGLCWSVCVDRLPSAPAAVQWSATVNATVC